MHCTSLLSTIFESLAPANERVYAHNEINFPQAKLDNEINVPFLLNEHGDPYFLSHNNSIVIVKILSSLTLKKFYRTEKMIWVKACKKPYSGMQIMTTKTTTIRTPYNHVVLNGVIFPQISSDIVPYARHFLPVRFFPKYNDKLCIQLPQNISWTDPHITRVISTSTCINGIRLAVTSLKRAW